MGDKGELKGAGFSFAVSDTQKYGGPLVISVKSPAAPESGRRGAGRCGRGSPSAYPSEPLRDAPDARGAAPVLGTHVAQKGSLVNDKALRFDFSHFEAMKPEEIRAVEDLVNAQIRRNPAIETNIMDIDAARIRRHGAVRREIR